MKTQLSRMTFNPPKNYSGVYQQQGRMITDADWNELVAIIDHRIRGALVDIIGNGTPRRDDRLADIALTPQGMLIKPGVIYANGMEGRIPGDTPFEITAQHEECPGIPVPPEDTALIVYADLWDRPVSAQEDADLLDPALHGADTCTRTQRMAQIKWEIVDETGDPLDMDTCTALLPPAKGNATLSELVLRSSLTDGGTDFSDEPEVRCGNYPFRLEVHDVAEDGYNRTIVLKWSSENGAECHRVATAPSDFKGGNWCYEFFSKSTEKQLGARFAGGHSPPRGFLRDSFPDAIELPLVRRWDGYCVLTFDNATATWTVTSGIDRGVALSPAHDPEVHGYASVISSTGLAASLSMTLNGLRLVLDLATSEGLAQFFSGDHWLAWVREAAIPEQRVTLPDPRPIGVEHRYLLMAVIDSTGNIQTLNSGVAGFPSLTDLDARDVAYQPGSPDEFPPSVNTVQRAIHELRDRVDQKHGGEVLQALFGWGVLDGLVPDPDTWEIGWADGLEYYDISIAVTEGVIIDTRGELIEIPPLECTERFDELPVGNQALKHYLYLIVEDTGEQRLEIRLDAPEVPFDKSPRLPLTESGSNADLFEPESLEKAHEVAWEGYRDSRRTPVRFTNEICLATIGVKRAAKEIAVSPDNREQILQPPAIRNAAYLQRDETTRLPTLSKIADQIKLPDLN